MASKKPNLCVGVFAIIINQSKKSDSVSITITTLPAILLGWDECLVKKVEDKIVFVICRVIQIVEVFGACAGIVLTSCIKSPKND
ncbi:MAG: hypothetical protein WBZ20_02965 [Nitrososphaeraceae archaeon]